MFACVPTSLAPGVPLNRPVLVLNAAQPGSFAIANVKLSPSASFALGVNEYCDPWFTVVAGVPVIVGSALTELTVIENAATEAPICPSVTLIKMFACVPTWLAPGVPLSCPVLVLNAAQTGWFAIANVKLSPSGSFAVGVNEYCDPWFTVVAGVPVIVGGALLAASTTMENGASEALACPSLTLITIFACVPTWLGPGVPLNCPVLVLKAAQTGGFATENVKGPPSGSFALGVNEYSAS